MADHAGLAVSEYTRVEFVRRGVQDDDNDDEMLFAKYNSAIVRHDTGPWTVWVEVDDPSS